LSFQPTTSFDNPLLLRCYRILCGKRLKDVADAANISIAQLSLIERGRRRLTPQVAERIAEALR
jgi:transcriptional regulator with XRE-family HTH domain